MTSKNIYKEVTRCSGSREAILIASCLDQKNIRFKLSRDTEKEVSNLRPTDFGTIIQVVEEDFSMAEEAISSYRKIQGVPYS